MNPSQSAQSFAEETQPLPNNNILVFKSDIISKAINMSENYEPIDELKLAEISNFTEKELEMVQLFWQPCFNRNWIYLSDYIILNFLTNHTGKDACNDFIRRILKPNYEEGIDYKEVSHDNEIVKSHLKENCKKIPHNKKFYLITIYCLKKLLIIQKQKLEKKSKNQKKNENDISNIISKKLNGKREVLVYENNRIDILTKEYIIEVKKYCNRFSSIGQLLYYAEQYPKHKKRIYLFDCSLKTDSVFEKICKNNNIEVIYFDK